MAEPHRSQSADPLVRNCRPLVWSNCLYNGRMFSCYRHEVASLIGIPCGPKKVSRKFCPYLRQVLINFQFGFSPANSMEYYFVIRWLLYTGRAKKVTPRKIYISDIVADVTYLPNLQSLQTRIQSIYPANFIKIKNTV